MSKHLKSSAKKWMERHVNDPYVKQAKMVCQGLNLY
jgi:23S rRNA U2552 (ribose-2'-O)-methylase RlmE/FtsJ